MLGPFTALYRSFLKRCTLTNKAVETIWRALSKPPQRRQGPDPRPLWLLVGTPLAFRPELAYWLRVAQPTLMDVPIYFDILLYYYICLCTTLLWPLRFGWAFVTGLSQISSFVSYILINDPKPNQQNRESTEGYSECIVWKNHDKFGNRTGRNNLNICKSQMGRDQVSGWVSVPRRHATFVANDLWKPLIIR